MGDFRKDSDALVVSCHRQGRDAASIKALPQVVGPFPLPLPNERTPLIAKNRGKGPVTSTRHIRRIVQDCFDRVYERMKADGQEEDPAELRVATVNWLRHTGISEDVKIRPREHVRDDAGHASMATTDRYIESDRRERHASGRRKQIKDL